MRNWGLPTVAGSKPDESLRALGQLLRERNYRFTTISPASHRRVNARNDHAAAASVEDVLGWSRPFRDGELLSDIFVLLQSAGALEQENGLWRSRLRASTLSSELLLHSAFPTDGADAVFFGPDTYRFCRAVRERLPALRASVRNAIDIGCGAGAGGIVLARELPDATVWMVDINDAALRLSQINVEISGLQNIQLRKSDLLNDIAGSFDLVIANPPYLVDGLCRTYRHGGGQLGEALSLKIVDAAIERLAPRGTLLLYTGTAVVDGRDAFRSEALARLEAAGFDFDYSEIDPDVFGEELESAPYDKADRIAVVLLAATRRPHA